MKFDGSFARDSCGFGLRLTTETLQARPEGSGLGWLAFFGRGPHGFRHPKPLSSAWQGFRRGSAG